MNCRLLLLSLAGVIVGVCFSNWNRHNPISAITATAVQTSAAGDSEVRIDRRFPVEPGGTLNVKVADADIIVESAAAGEAHVEILLEADDMDRARSYFDHLNFRVEQQGNTILITHDHLSNPTAAFRRIGGAEITIRALIPQQFNAALTTADGDVLLENALAGRLEIRTSDGDIVTADAAGPVIALRTSDGDILTGALQADEITLLTSDGDVSVPAATAHRVTLKTSDGDIVADRVQGAAELITSDGDILLGALSGAEIRIRTSDGEIKADELSAETAEVVTSDGNIQLGRVDSRLRAVTSSGNLNVSLLKSADVQLHSTDGNILVSAPLNFPADLRLRGGDVRISSDYAFSGMLAEDHAEGRLNGGGPLLEAVTTDGTVSIEAQ